jgi:hypothetical protein
MSLEWEGNTDKNELQKRVSISFDNTRDIDTLILEKKKEGSLRLKIALSDTSENENLYLDIDDSDLAALSSFLQMAQNMVRHRQNDLL